MARATFTRICAVGAIQAGVLRAISSFVPETAPGIFGLYLAVDIFLALGVIGLLRSHARDELLGLIGCALMLLALLVLIGRDIGLVPAGAYTLGAPLFSLGLDLFAIQVLLKSGFPRWIPVAWILSTIVGAIGFFGPGLHFLFAVSGLFFGVAFAAAGIHLWRLASRTVVSS